MNLAYTRIELKRSLRNPRFMIFAFAFPVFLFLLQTNVFIHDGDPGKTTATAVIMVNMLAFGVFFAAMTNGGRLATERAAGWQRQLRLTPLTGRGYMLGKGLTGLLLGLPVLIAVPLIAALTSGVHLDPAAWTRIILGTWLGAVPFVLLGLLIGQLARPETLQPLNMGLSLVMGFLGGMWIPIDAMPDWMQGLAPVLPSYWLTQLGRGAVTGDLSQNLATTAAVLAAWTIALGALVIWRYRKDSSRS
ncbi:MULTISPECIES: ABC transporter permease [Glycomyces]|uniref:ABC transporter permease n=2 Tax=Glycomyces TaxID=58113 RepID=A0A9X3PMG1_9ACTN|nr:ABC transporter permease [Glycomyces lechevalierae]MDA1387492.1 ABC transporter permease [Glycomyces lechevalierae]MDR7338668.1 ABC-2 type transport system permease protein [Glycomyces lechevalierae]